MAEYDNTNRGSIWKNDKKTTDAHPDFRGEANIDGVEFWVSAWRRKEGANPKAPALSFSFAAKEEAPQKPAKPQPASINEVDDDIPW